MIILFGYYLLVKSLVMYKLKKVNSFVGADNVRYVVAMVEPNSPKVAQNDMVAGIWKMQDMIFWCSSMPKLSASMLFIAAETEIMA